MRWLAFLFLVACSSDSSGGSSSGATGACPNVAGSWKVTKHCDSSLVGQPATVTQKDCALSFAPPFDGFTGSIDKDGKVTLGGPQQCTGTGSANGFVLTCTPGTCAVEIGH